MMLAERWGLATTLSLNFKGDVKRETRFLAQYGQLICTVVAIILIYQLDRVRGPQICKALAAAALGVTIVGTLLKRMLGRARPRREHAGKFLGPSFRHANHRESFPSSHSAVGDGVLRRAGDGLPAGGRYFLGAGDYLRRAALHHGCALAQRCAGWNCARFAGFHFVVAIFLFVNGFRELNSVAACTGLTAMSLWDFSDLTDRLHEIVQAAEEALRLEQAVYGLDTRDERALQTLLANGLARHYEIAREVYYPSSAGRKLTHRQRCDLVLSPRGRPLRLDSSVPTLFDPPDQATPEESLWLEMKIAYQFREGGVRHQGYGGQWRTAVVDDLKKMEAEAHIHHAGLVLVVFNESLAILDKDLELFETVLAQKEVLAGFRKVKNVPILDRIGHQLCTIAVWPTIQR